MKSEWKELKIGNLPSDIAVVDYEIECFIESPEKEGWVRFSVL